MHQSSSALSQVLKMGWLYCLLFLCLAFSTLSGQEFVEFFTLHDTSSEAFRGSSDQPGEAVAVSVPNELLNNVSDSVLAAENFVRTHILSHYPATNITTIIVGNTLLCETHESEKSRLILPSMKNLYYCLTRWGLQKVILVSASFGSSCLHLSSGTYRLDMSDSLIHPLLEFLQSIRSPYLVNAPSEKYEHLLAAHSNALRKLGFLNLGKINAVVPKPTSRRLSFLDSEVVYPFPPRPTPLAPDRAPTGSTTPAYAANTPLPPLVGNISPPPLSIPFAPELPPMVHPGSPHYGPHLPPCAPPRNGGSVATPPAAGVGHGGLWCVAKPSVPPETLQEALDYACGEGGADCDAIQPTGNCYFPDTVVAHASYAFNSYWQKTKVNGGTCGFGGTAMLINSDPSYRHCRFIVT